MVDDANLRRAVSAIENAQVTDTQKLPSQRHHDSEATDALLKIYLKKRIDGQLRFYQARIKEYDANSGFMVSVGAFIMAVGAVISAIGTTNNSAELALITALLPALAAMIAALRQLYQWEKQSSLYRDAELGLQEATLLMPDMDMYDPRTAPAILPSLVRASEKVFTSEINQWGQIALGEDVEEADALNTALFKIAGQFDAIDNKTAVNPTRGSSSSAPTMPPPPPADFNDGGVG